ncbi:MAG: hypothetical protein ACRENE_00035, partial [Polyangiaceae bacterium]
MRDLRLVAIPLVVLLAGACDNSLLVAKSSTDAEAGAGDDLGDGSPAPGDAAPNEAAPGDGTARDGGPPLEGTPGDASMDDGGNGGDGAPGLGDGDTGTGEATADGSAGEAAAETAGDAADAGTTEAGTDAGTDGASGEGGTTNPYGPSCGGLPNTCGPLHDESCCANSLVPGGTFNRDNNASYPATVDSFVLDRFEVTVGRFRKFYAQYPGNQPAGGSGIN